jgi:hypothetical protein
LQEVPPERLSNVELSGLGLGTAADRSIHLVLRILDFHLSYKISSVGLRSTARKMLDLAKTLEADETRRH